MDENNKFDVVGTNIAEKATMIWNVADMLRGPFKPHEYGLVILPMTVVKRFHDCLLPTHKAVLEQYEKVKNFAVIDGFLAKASGYQFYNISKYTFESLLADPENIEANFRDYLNGFSANVQDVLAKFDFDNIIRRMVESNTLYLVIKEFNSQKGYLGPDKISAVDCGYIFEDLVKRFSESFGEEAGAHFTSRDIIYLMTDLLLSDADLSKGGNVTVYDMAMGTSQMLSCMEERIQELNTEIGVTCFGQEFNPSTFAIATWSASLWNKQVIAWPSAEEQERIVSFLDEKCAHIDSVLEKTRNSIEEYKKLKQAVITQAVTKGIKNDCRVKSSKIEWIDKIPEKWKEIRIKNIFDFREEKNYIPLEEVNLLSLYTDLGVIQHSDLEKTVGNKAVNADGYKKVYENDIIVNIILCWMGAIGISKYDGVTSPAYDVYCPRENVDSKFYHYYFRTTGFASDCYKRGRGIMAMRWRTYSDQFRDIKVVYPPLREQKEIVQYLDEKCNQIENLVKKKKKFIEELEFYKKSLIYEYVTGKKEVPEF